MRRRALLEAARALMTEVGSIDLSLSELARRSGISKANIYRYFESREEVLLQVWVEEVRVLAGALEKAFAKLKPHDVAGTSSAIARAFVAQPQLCELTSIVSLVLERNLSAEAIFAAKQTLAALTLQIAQLMHRQLPKLTLEQCAWGASTAAAFVAGLWPGANPKGAAAEVLKRPELKGMCPDFDRDLTRFLVVLLTGLHAAR